MKITYNKTLLWIILFLLVVLGIVIFSINRIGNNQTGKPECRVDEDCVPTSCCHPSSCVAKENAPDCSGIFCTMECAPGTLDCGQGTCRCSNESKCEAVFFSK